MSAVVDLKTEVQFAELISKMPYVIVQAYATWCPPCRTISPIYDNYSGTYSIPEKCLFTRLNIDDCDELARKLGVRSIPAFYFFKNGNRAGNIVGADPYALEKLVQAFSNEARETQGDIEAQNDQKSLNSHT
ncbi:Thioredoxin domain-containing protein [Fusarium sp. LHS14.1]|nr:Thioredoxin domain-containing protein [Fusarium sp. LHS14.1]